VVKKAGTVKVTCTLTGAGRAATRTRAVRILLRTTYRASDGTSVVQTSTVSLPRATAKR
jgi:hypothetical protein